MKLNFRLIKNEKFLNLNFYKLSNYLTFNTKKGKVDFFFKDVKFLSQPENFATKDLNFFAIDKSSMKFFVNSFNKMIKSISNGFFFELSLRGIGFKCYFFNQKTLFLSLGYSHFILYNLPQEVVVFLKKGKIFLYTLSKEVLGNVVSDLKNLRIPDAYKAKGIVESHKIFSLKEGKKR